ncbi:uncharacterized protein N7459_009172 [Penicillium hispanicum]|uniref:uncharacterized protein n=1 Tax=Penicillium hispanicum TaxID=1080232 RepID=UPI0025414F9A|nr:uncharacterized protein N7459_009172 [Penicillium hispanicum]KAJ5569742.1 hypothetical protein N7459_009172 [Penicillium hispanicum]
MAMHHQSAIQHQASPSQGNKMNPHDNPKQFPALAPGPPPSSFGFEAKKELHCLSIMQSGKKKIRTDRSCLLNQCSGPPSPCKACSGAGTENDCHFDPSRDLRRKVAVKRTIQELSDYKDLLDSLLMTLQSAHRDKIEGLVHLIQNNGSMKEIALAVGSPVTQFTDSKRLSMDNNQPFDMGHEIESSRDSEQDPVLDWPEDEAVPRPIFDPYARVSLESLCDIPLFKVSAKPWTGVIEDDDLVSHLVSLYFTWDHPCAQFVDQDIFLEHMRRGDPESEFCSPLLVNSLLSMASVYSDSPDVFSDAENVFSRGQIFLEEAERLLRAQDGRSTLCNIQALLLMCYLFSYQGNTNMAWVMLRQGVQHAQDMGLFMLPHERGQPEENGSPEMERVRAITAWGFANLDRPVPSIHVGGNHDVDWIPYPRSNQITYSPKPAYLPQVRQGLVELTELVAEARGLLSDKGSRTRFHELVQRAEEPYNRLQRWLANWPEPSEIRKEPNPQLLTLRIKSLHATTDLLETLIERDEQGTLTDRFQQAWRHQIDDMTRCLRVYRESWGLKDIPSQLTDVIQTALHTLVHRLEEIGEARNAFIELCRFGIILSHKSKPTAETIHAILSLSRRGVVRLPTEAIAILDGSEARKGQKS